MPKVIFINLDEHTQMVDYEIDIINLFWFISFLSSKVIEI